MAFAAIFKILKESKTFRALVEPDVTAHLLPEMQSTVPFLRSRACWVVEYLEYDWEDEHVLPAILSGLVSTPRVPGLCGRCPVPSPSYLPTTRHPQLASHSSQITTFSHRIAPPPTPPPHRHRHYCPTQVGGMRDGALPVQSAAACSLRTLIGAEGAKELLRPYLRNLVAEYFRIMQVPFI